MNSNLQLKHYFLKSLVVSLVASALMGIGVFILGNFGDLEGRILGTVISVGIFSLTGLCCSILYENNSYRVFGLVGVVLSLISFIVTLLMLWEILDLDDGWQLLLILVILAFSMAHASLLLLLRRMDRTLEVVRNSSLACIGIVALMLLILIANEGDIRNDAYFRAMGVFAILDVLGTIVTPIMFKMAAMKGNES